MTEAATDYSSTTETLVRYFYTSLQRRQHIYNNNDWNNSHRTGTGERGRANELWPAVTLHHVSAQLCQMALPAHLSNAFLHSFMTLSYLIEVIVQSCLCVAKQCAIFKREGKSHTYPAISAGCCCCGFNSYDSFSGSVSRLRNDNTSQVWGEHHQRWFLCCFDCCYCRRDYVDQPIEEME